MRRRVLLAVWGMALAAAEVSAQPVVVEYYQLDALGSIRAVTDSSGAVVERHEYLPFGEEWNGALSEDALRFTGKERDEETGLDYFGARYYGANVGRFTTTDPLYTWGENLVDPQRWNRYAYVRNNPLRYTDPDGRAVETPWDALNVAIGVASFGANVAAGNVGGAVVDALGIVYDVTATAVPVLPGGAGTSIRAARAADKAVDLVKAGDKAADVARAAARGGFDSFSSLKRALGPAGEGKQWHHIVEQSQVGKFGSQAIHNTDNVVAIPTDIHRKISGFYSSKQPFTGGQTVREWLGSQSFEKQREFGQQVLRTFGVGQ